MTPHLIKLQFTHVFFVDVVRQDERVATDNALGSFLDLYASVLRVLNPVVVYLLGVCMYLISSEATKRGAHKTFVMWETCTTRSSTDKKEMKHHVQERVSRQSFPRKFLSCFYIAENLPFRQCAGADKVIRSDGKWQPRRSQYYHAATT